MTFPALLHYLPCVVAANMIFTGNGSTAPRTDSGRWRDGDGGWRCTSSVHNNSAEAESGPGKNMCTSLSCVLGEDGWAVGTMGSDMGHEDIGDTMESHRDPGQWPSLQCCSAAAAQQQRRHSAVHCTVVYILSGWLLLVPFVSTGFESTRFIFV